MKKSRTKLSIKAPKKCRWCHKTFRPHRKDQRFCNHKCSYLGHNRDLKESIKSIPWPLAPCSVCKKPCPRPRRKFCSSVCYRKNTVEQMRTGTWAKGPSICQL